MRTSATRMLVKYQDRRYRMQDESGLTLLAYALGAAFIVIPLAVALIFFGDSAVEEADAGIDSTLGN